MAWGGRAPAECPDFRRGKKREANEAQSPFCPWPMLPALGLAVGKTPTTSPRSGRTWRGGGVQGKQTLTVYVHPSPRIPVLCTLCNACSRCEEIPGSLCTVIDEGRRPASPLLATRWPFRPANLSDGRCRLGATWWPCIFQLLGRKGFF